MWMLAQLLVIALRGHEETMIHEATDNEGNVTQIHIITPNENDVHVQNVAYNVPDYVALYTNTRIDLN